LEDLGVDGRIVLNGSSRDRKRELTGLIWHRTGTSSGAVVNAAMKFWVPYNARDFLTG
jgi:hypothetical protein